MTDEVVNNIENHSFDGNVAVGRDLVTGGQLVARGNSIFNRNVLVEGWLTAKNIRITDQGVVSEQTHVYKNGIISEALSYFKKGIVSNELSYFFKGITIGSDNQFYINEEGIAQLESLKIGKLFSFTKDGIIAHGIQSESFDTDNQIGFSIATKTDGGYKLCLDEILAWGKASLGELQVRGNSQFDGNTRFGGELSSKQFSSGFIGGKGWSIFNTPVLNSAGEQEDKWTAEFDNINVRGMLRVFEMVVSQLLGENDNRIFTGMLEVDHYDAESGKVYLDTKEGTMYNPFRKDDYIMVQQYNGEPSEDNNYYVTKGYELIVTEVGSEGTGKDVLAWVKFRDFTTTMEGATAESLIKKKDTFVRVDNLSDSQRKGIIQLMTVGANTPYMDIIYGLKTDPNNALKGRLGNLKGIVHPILGELSGFGEFLNNLYAVGDFIIQRTGESVDSKLQVLENMFSSRFSQTSYELTNSDNYLENGQFLEQVRDDEDTIISCWAVDTTDESMFWADALGNPFMVNGLLSVSGNRKVSIDKMDGRQVLRLQNCGVKQLNAHIRQPGTHKEYQQPSGSTGDNGLKKPATGSTDVQDRLYISIRIFAKTAGTLTVGFEDCSSVSGKSNTLTAQNVAVPYSGDWTNIPLEGVWNGTGNFVLRYTGDCYIAIASITDKPLSEFSKSVSTQIKQTATNIQLLGENIDSVNGTTTQLGLDLDAAKKQISIYVEQTNKNSKSISDIQVKVGSIEQTVGQAATKKQLEEDKNTLVKAIGDNLDAAKGYADNVGTEIRNDYDDAVTTVIQKKDSWNVASGMFDKNGNLTDLGIASITPTVTTISNTRFDEKWGEIKSGYVTTGDFARLFSQACKDGEVVTSAQISTFITKDETNKLISNATIQADKIALTGHTMAFTGNQITIDTSNFKLDKNGNVSMNGEINATSGSIAGFSIYKNSLGAVGQSEGMGLSSEYLKFMNLSYLHGGGYFITCGSYLDTGLRINSTTSESNDISTGILVDITAGTVTPSDPISGGKMCTALDLRTRWADQAGSFDMTNPYEGNHAIVIRGGNVIGLRPSFVRLAANYQTLTEYHHTIEYYNTSAITVYLPSSPKYGQCYTIIQRGSRVTFSSSGKEIYDVRRASSATTFNSDIRGQVSWLWYNGSQWIVCYTTN